VGVTPHSLTAAHNVNLQSMGGEKGEKRAFFFKNLSTVFTSLGFCYVK
jgi:hypothetical protein